MKLDCGRMSGDCRLPSKAIDETIRVPTPLTVIPLKMSKGDSIGSITIQALELSARNISINGRDFVDEHGRVLDLRGANVGSASKV